MRVLVTGANGFVGRALLPVLTARGHSIIATDLDCAGLSQSAQVDVLEGDITDKHHRSLVVAQADAIVHLATVPGGAAEQSPDLARRVNVEAGMSLVSEFAAGRARAPFVFASSIAVLGSDLPEVVDDTTALAPQMLYGAHKAMLETWLEALSRRGQLSAISVRLPGIVARPQGPSGMKSAFLSDLFHALATHRAIVLPVSPSSTTWLLSVSQVAECMAHALDLASRQFPECRTVTLPALRVRMDELVAEVCKQCGADPALASYRADEAIERGFGRSPPLITACADRLGFVHDGDLGQLVRSALQTLTKEPQ